MKQRDCFANHYVIFGIVANSCSTIRIDSDTYNNRDISPKQKFVISV